MTLLYGVGSYRHFLLMPVLSADGTEDNSTSDIGILKGKRQRDDINSGDLMLFQV